MSLMQGVGHGTPNLAPKVDSSMQGLKPGNDGNNVNMDHEARMLAENALRFNVASNLVKTQLKLLNSAIQGGNGS